MRCEVGVHTGRIILLFRPEDYRVVREAIPAHPKLGRSWVLTERDGGVLMSRTPVGSGSSRDIKGRVVVRNDAETTVRCTSHARPFELPRAGQLFVPMPPHHLWPWMVAYPKRHTEMTPAMWRWHLVQEINARVRSATAHHVDFPTNVPSWASRVLTDDEWKRVHRNEEI